MADPKVLGDIIKTGEGLDQRSFGLEVGDGYIRYTAVAIGPILYKTDDDLHHIQVEEAEPK